MPSCAATTRRPDPSSSRPARRGGRRAARPARLPGSRPRRRRCRVPARSSAASRADGVELERDLVVSHARHDRASRHDVASPTVTPLGIGIVGTGNIAGGYASDILTHPEIRLVAATDLMPTKAAAFARGARLPGPRLARRAPGGPDGRHRRQPDHPPRPLRGDQARPRGRPARLQREADGAALERGTGARRARGGARAAPRLLARRPSSARRSRRPPA